MTKERTRICEICKHFTKTPHTYTSGAGRKEDLVKEATECRRYPTPVFVDRTYWCGEFAEDHTVERSRPL